jgi:N,N'-diacetyllegionaminate synthase
MVKFQTWRTGALMTREAPLAEYQKGQGSSYASQYEMARSLELPYEAFRTLKEHCESTGIRFLSTPDEEESLNFLVDELGMQLIKIGSGEITNLPFLKLVGRKGVEVILSTGMASLEEVQRAWQLLADAGAGRVSLLHCTSNYPAPFEEVNLRAIQTLRDRFGTTVGFSDHTRGIEAAIAAVAMGATIIEKHLTLDRSLPGPDHLASIEPPLFRAMVDAIRNVEKALGDGVKRMQPSEAQIRKVVTKSLVAKRPIARGELFTLENVTAKRAGKGIEAERWPEVEGKAASRDFAEDELIDL